MSGHASMNVHRVVRAEASAEHAENANWVAIRLFDNSDSRVELALFTDDPEGLLAQIAQSTDYVQGVKDAAKLLDTLADRHAEQYSFTDPDTGVAEFKRGEQEDYYNTLRELADDIRDLAK